MPVSNALSSSGSTKAFTVPAGSLGYTVVNEHLTAAVRIRPYGGECSATDDARKGLPLAPASAAPFSVLFGSPLTRALDVQACSDTNGVLLTYEYIPNFT
jgi:hypothetical protein